MKLLREIVTRACRLGECKVGDAKLLTDRYKGFHTAVGPLGFSIQASFRKNTVQPESPDWRVTSMAKPNCTWWRNDFSDGTSDLDAVMKVVACARASFFAYK